MNQSNTIAVTGASRGIGSAIARELASRGFRVACLSRKGKGVEDAEIDPAVQERLIAIPYEATDESSIGEALRAAAAADGLLGLVNNAGIHWIKPATEVSAADFQEMMRVNALGTFLACREAHQHLKKDGGIIVNIGSYYDRLGGPRQRGLCGLEGRDRRHYALPCRRMGARRHPRSQRGARLHRD